MTARTADQDKQLLDLAHAAALDWQEAGAESNHMRATMFLAEAHCLAGSPTLALRFGKIMHDYFTRHPTDPSELALAHGILAHAAKLTADIVQHAILYQLAQDTLGQIKSSEDRDLVAATFQHIPVP